MMSSHHRSGSSTSFLFSIPSCFFFFFIILVLFSLSSFSSSANALLMTFHSQQCLDLLDLKKGFDLSNASTSLSDWLAGTNCCGWEGVSCDKASGLVDYLDLSERYMGGNIMPSLFNLTSLQTLNLAYNSFNQSAVLLSDFEKLANLTHLNLSNSGIDGQVPMGISRLTKLISLDLSSYFMYALMLEKPDLGTLIRHLSNLKELYLDGVDISSSRTEWCQAISDSAPGLQALSLQDSSLSGPIDSSLSKLRNLSILRLDDNDLFSQVPEFFAKFSSLTELSLSACGLRGLFPGSVFELLNLKTLDLSSNSNLTGVLPEFPLNSSLERLTISGTNFSGSLPNSLGNLESLISLDLGYCNFSGSIPWSIGNLSELVYLDLSGNHLSGHLPPMLAGSKISTIDLSSNYFTGQIPSTLGHAHHIISLHLDDNSLTGSIPMSLFTLPLLEELYLADNKLSGQLHEFTNASSTLEYVDLRGNNLHGKLPKSLVNLFALGHLDWSSNNFDGSVVGLELFGHLQNLTYLDLSGIDMSISDRIAGSSLLFPSLVTLILQSCNLMAIPSFLKHEKNMDVLDLSNNRINGIIPKWIWSIGSTVNLSRNSFTDIERPLPDPLMMFNSVDLHSNMLQGQIPLLKARFLDYSNNYFTGSIPFNISAYLLGARFFSLANNNLTGEVPTSICDTNLKILDLSNNSLSGSIHECLLESLSNLQVLNLRRNQFRGILPRNIHSSCSLVIINFYGNKLEGEIPKSLAKCEKLEFLDLGSNKLAGFFPYWLGNLPSLKVLVLRENRFYGYFECPLGASAGNHTFEVLQILDISSNNFTGNLPLDCFTRMKAMMIPQEGGGTIGFSYNEPYRRGCQLIYSCPAINPEYYNPASTYYEDLVTVVAKGYKRDLSKIPASTSYIDVSNNRLEGTLPEVIGDLKSLNFLNMSLNAFKGHIPQIFGNLRDLESLDLSGNQLSGEIPNSLTSLTFLSILNLSNNNLVGRIWIWMFRGLGFGVGFALAFCRQVLFAKLKIWYKRRFMNR